jgi:hypothetical protein
MSIKISNLAQDNLVELNAADSTAVIGGTHRPAAPRPTGGSASTSGISTIGTPGAVATSIQTASASGPGGNLANSSTSASLEHGILRTDGGALAINGVTPNVTVNLTGAFNRT